MRVELWVWAAFGGFVVGMLLLDLAFFGRRGEEISLRRAVAWSIGWSALGAWVSNGDPSGWGPSLLLGSEKRGL